MYEKIPVRTNLLTNRRKIEPILSSCASKKDQLRHDFCIIYGPLKGTQMAKSSLF
jgi:hypothetical protein